MKGGLRKKNFGIRIAELTSLSGSFSDACEDCEEFIRFLKQPPTVFRIADLSFRKEF
jgi:hypothetical protein